MPDTLPFKFASPPAALSFPLRITSKFGERKHPLSGQPSEHRGLDIAAPAGTPALAVFAGIVIRTGLREKDYNTGCGEGVLIGHATNPNRPNKITYTTNYCHFQQGSTAGLAVGMRVNAGQPIGRVGTTGASTAPHLHFELREVNLGADIDFNTLARIPDTPIDPEPYIRQLERGATDYLSTQVSEYRANLAGITPYIESLESFHPRIQYELTRRRVSTETANTYMPFVKLTSLSKVLVDNLPAGQTSGYCPSLGIHGQDGVSFENIYDNKTATEKFARLARLTDVTLTQQNRSIIGYAVTADGTRTTPVVVSDPSKDAKNIPIPGITQITVERSTAGPMGVRGGLMKADLKIVAYSVGQVDALLRYYLRPATRVVLELGRKSSSKNEQEIKTFNWQQKESDIKKYFSELIKSPTKQQEFIRNYIYESYGNYEIFVAYVVKFNLKYNKNNTYEIDLTLHSVQQFEVPTKHTGVQSICPSPTTACKVMDVQEYFSDAYSWKNNSFLNLMSHYETDTLSADELYWKSQIIPIKKTDSTPNAAGGPSTAAGTRENEYFVSWNFFVEKILNDNQYGIASMLGNAEVANLALLRVTGEPSGSTDEGLIANQVGYHPNLRSVNPDVMIIWNETAQQRFEQTTDFSRFDSITNLAKRDSDLKIVEDIQKSLESSDIETALKAASTPFSRVSDNGKAGASFLGRGIWLNTKSIKQAFTSTDTISAGISMLLNMMNSTTEGYWNLQLYSTDVKNPGMHIIDMGLSKEPKIITQSPTNGIDQEENESTNILNSIQGINLQRYHGESEDKPKYIYMFNRGTKRFNDGELGSDLIDLNVEFNMPQVIAVQAIANIGGPAQKSTLQSINIKELREITLIDNLYTPCDDNSICREEGTCQSAQIQEFSRAAELARQAEADVVAAEQRAPRATDVQLRASDARLATARSNRETAELRLAAVQVDQYNPNLVGTVREYADLGTAIKMIEINPSRMMKELNKDSTNVEDGRVPATTHAFNSSNLTKTVVDVTLPGIGGINLFQSFLVDRVPSIIDRGFYVVTKISHEFTTQNGWITKIQGRFRFRPTTTGTAPYNPCGT